MWQSIISFFKPRADLALETLALRQQLAVLKRQKKPKIRARDRMFWILLKRFWPSWKAALHIVQPDMVVRWQRKGFRAYWRFKSRNKGGRPRIDPEIRNLIVNLWRLNPTWGKPRIQAELAKLGIQISCATVMKYRPKTRKPPSQTWKTFLKNHMTETCSMDFLTVPTATFGLLYVLVILSHERREIVHVNVTSSPNADWIARQITEAFPYQTAPRFLLRDNDKKYGHVVSNRIEAMGIADVTTTYRSPWQNPYCERVIGSIRRECLDHVIVINPQHLRRVLKDYLAYYHESRTHQSLDNDWPISRSIEPPEVRDVIAFPKVGGLHHRYAREGTKYAA